MSRLSRQLFFNGNLSDVEILFIMESPGDFELRYDYACVGPTGDVMSKYLYTTESASLGKLLKSGRERKIAILETFAFPINLDLQDNQNTPFERYMCELKCIDERCKRMGRRLHYNTLKSFWESYSFYREKFFLILQYKMMLKKLVRKLNENAQIVICGFIAQSCFMQAFEPRTFKSGFPPYGKLFRYNDGKSRRLYFSNHPSVELYTKPNKWKYGYEYRFGCIA